MIRQLITLTFALLTALSVPVFAGEQTESATWQKIDPAWTKTSEQIIDFVGENKQKLLADLAYAAVVAETCQGLPLDKTKFQQAFDTNFNEKSLGKTMKPAELVEYGHKVSMYFGVYVGLLTADSMMERDNFCNAAQQMKANGEAQYWSN